MAELPETPAAAAKRRRRWITLGETIGILALGISAASLWDSHQQRETERAAAAQEKARPVHIAPLVLTASVADEGEVLRLATSSSDRVIQTQTISFPAAFGISSVDTVGNSRLEAGWFAAGLRSALGDDRKSRRFPVAIVTAYLDNGTERTDTAIYDIGHGWRTRLIGRDVPVLEGITLVSRGEKNLQARLDARWTKAHPPKSE